MSFDPPRIQVSPTDGVLGHPIMVMKQPGPVEPRPSFGPPAALPPPNPLDAVAQGLLALTLEVNGLRADLERRYQAVWFRRLWRWIRTWV